MKVIAIYGRARKKGFSAAAVDHAVSCFRSRDTEVESFYLTDMNIKPCIGCFACRRKEGCVQRDDMSSLFQKIVDSDFVIFSSPIYCFSSCSSFNRMFERLYPMLGGGMALGEGMQKYTHRYPPKKCMMIFSQGAPGFMCGSAHRRVKSNLKMNGFDNLGTIVIDMTYRKKKTELTEKQRRYIEKICAKIVK